MSGFQLYRFKSIDRPLTKDEQAEVNSWSSRGRVNLVRLAKGEKNMEVVMNYRLKKFTDKNSDISNENRPSPLELLAKSKDKESERLDKEAALAKIAYEKKMKELSGRKDGLWREVNYNIELKSGKGYDRATAVLKDLKDLAVYEKNEAAFREKMMELKAQFGRSTALIGRFQKAQLFS